MQWSPSRSSVVAVLIVLAVAFTATSLAAPPTQGRIQHVVMLWLKEPGSAEARARLIEATLELEAIPGVVDISAGIALASERPQVDDSFDVGVVFVFDSADAMREYLAHAQHQRTVAEVLAPLVDRMLVYDIVE